MDNSFLLKSVTVINEYFIPASFGSDVDLNYFAGQFAVLEISKLILLQSSITSILKALICSTTKKMYILLRKQKLVKNGLKIVSVLSVCFQHNKEDVF